jgi:hypothetical protein
MMTRSKLLILAALLAGCSPATRRPAFAPMPEARRGDLELEVPAATDTLAKALIAAGIPVGRVAPRDGYLETPWFDSATGRPAGGRPLGEGRVRVRGWVTPSRRGSSEVIVETVFRPFADPSAPPRDLERSVAYTHPVRARVRSALTAVGARSSVEESDAIALADRRARKDARPTPAGDSMAVRTATPDTTLAVVDTTPVARDSAAAAVPDTAVREVAPARRPAPTITPPAAAPAPRTGTYSVQVAATSDSAVADLAASRLRDLGYTPRVMTEGALIKVRTARYPSQAAARTVQRRLRATFPDAFLTRR